MAMLTTTWTATATYVDPLMHGVNRRGSFTPDRRAIETPVVDGVERVGERSCAA